MNPTQIEALLFPLDPTVYQDRHWCPDCGGTKTAYWLYETEDARVGLCAGCEKRIYERLSRATSEAA